MSSLPDRERAIRQRLKDDFEHYASRCLRIRTKSGAVAPFALNRTEHHLHDRLERQRRETGRVRAVVLKGRQVGISTYIAGRFYWRISHRKGARAFILTHLDTASENLFGMARRFHEHCPEIVRPETGKANAKELSFVHLDSGYKVATAGTAEVGRSETIQMFHGSEVAFWPNAQNHSAGIRQAIADVDGTEDIRESTANGVGNPFHAEYKAAERGDSEYEAIFLPWFWHEEYARPPEAGWSAPEAWIDYQKAYQLDTDQTYWAWLKNRDLAVLAGGTPDEPCWQFRQEYPANADEAFQTSGADAFIKPDTVIKARKNKTSSHGAIILGIITFASTVQRITGPLGLLLAGYSAKPYQRMGDAFMLPSIAVVVLGGTHILGGRGRYLGTLVGVILIVFLNSVLSIMQMPEAYRQIIYGTVIVGMLLVYGRDSKGQTRG